MSGVPVNVVTVFDIANTAVTMRNCIAVDVVQTAIENAVNVDR